MKDLYFEADAIGDIPGRLGEQGTRRYADGPKRALDLVFVLLALPIVLPVMSAIWAAIRCQGGSGLFVQKRVGRGGRSFDCYKFRTMVPDAEARLAELCRADPARAQEWSRNQKLRNDPRITGLGRVLRATSLDELPQIFNVLKGDMSLVGPRPFLPDQEPLYREAGGLRYFDLRPGLTGLWQVSDRHLSSFVARVGFDEAYAETVSLRADLGILWKTLRVVLRGSGA